MSPRAPSRVLRHDGDGMAWELAYGTPRPQVAPYIR